MNVADPQTAPAPTGAAHPALKGTFAKAIRAAQQKKARTYVALDAETRLYVDTNCAAFHLNRQPRTLRAWATGEIPGPITAKRDHGGRLMWAVSDLRRALGVESEVQA